MLVVSACLAGMKVRYNGTDCLEDVIGEMVRSGKAVTVCPEILGGFQTPREPAEIQGGTGEDVLDGTARVVDRSGADVTEHYIARAIETLAICRKMGATDIVLKENSPSCGSSMIYNGDFSGEKIPGEGVTTALLKRNGIKVWSEEDAVNEFV
ncbi:hypothetical protein ANABIO32_11840 [Rossellomorea marisflavi]|uniref:DUF523 domain-containing protein n=1 Tax=Rossellomorea marisflavi TaxID=189381 RepID=UPI0025C7EE41|nr:DUF523 domain-containing protein [Rossellomorea marisflavi]GLI83491.1 hypothetical protein ANABIO32_11840 [Rossellomorea marisflavi]